MTLILFAGESSRALANRSKHGKGRKQVKVNAKKRGEASSGGILSPILEGRNRYAIESFLYPLKCSFIFTQMCLK